MGLADGGGGLCLGVEGEALGAAATPTWTGLLPVKVSLAGWGSAQAFPVAVNLSALRPPPGLPVAVGELVSGLWTT